MQSGFTLQQDQHLSFSDFFDKYSPAVYGRILTVIKDKDVAEKILERVFVRSWEQRNNNISNLSDFTSLINESRNSTYHILKSIKLYKAISCGKG